MDDDIKHEPTPEADSEPVDSATEADVDSEASVEAPAEAVVTDAVMVDSTAEDTVEEDDDQGDTDDDMPVAEADAAEVDTAVEAEEQLEGFREQVEDDSESHDDESYEDEPEPAPAFDWASIGAAAAVAGDSDVPDLTATGETSFEVDIDAALAAVDSLDTVVAAEQLRKQEEVARREAQQRAEDEYRRWAASYVFSRPGMIRVQGGRIVTILPAVALMAVGSVLTLATASGQTLTWQTFGAAACAGLSLSLVSYWLASGRWARGALFSALLVGVIGGWLFATTVDGLSLPWWLPFTLLGVAIALTGVLARPFSAVWLVTGTAIAVGAAIVTLFAFGPLTTAAPYVLGAAAVLAILPLIFRPRRA